MTTRRSRRMLSDPGGQTHVTVRTRRTSTCPAQPATARELGRDVRVLGGAAISAGGDRHGDGNPEGRLGAYRVSMGGSGVAAL